MGADPKVQTLMATFKHALVHHELSTADDRKIDKDFKGGLTEKQGQNRNAVYQATRKLGKKKLTSQVKTQLKKAAKNEGGWAPFCGPESFSPEYTGWWMMALSVLLEDEWWDSVGRVWMAANALAAVEAPKKIVMKAFVKKSGKWVTQESERTLSGSRLSATGGDDWRWGSAPFSQMPGPRFLWEFPLTPSTLIQRSIVHPCLGLAAGRKEVRIDDWKHENYGIPLAVLLNQDPDKARATGKAEKPDSWGTIELDKKAVEHLDWLPKLPRNVWFRYQWFDDGTKFVAMSRGRTGTRGTVPLSKSKGDVVTYYTAATERGGGEWMQCETRLDGKKWVVESSSGSFNVRLPGTPVLEVLWDREGARVLGEPLEGGGVSEHEEESEGGGPVQGAKKQAILDFLDAIDDDAIAVEPQGGANHKHLQGIRNKTGQIRISSNDQQIRAWLDGIDEATRSVDPPGGRNHKPLQGIRNKTEQIRGLL